MFAAPWQKNFEAALLERNAECPPVLFRPELLGTARRMQENDLRTPARRVLDSRQTVIRQIFHAKPERRGYEFAVSHHGVLRARHVMSYVVKGRGQSFAGAGSVKTMAPTDRRCRDQRALEQALRVDHGIV